jgi:hypothetical protein
MGHQGSEDLFGFISHTQTDSVLASLQSLAGPVDLSSFSLDSCVDELSLEATIESSSDTSDSPLWSCSDASSTSSEGDDYIMFDGIHTPMSEMATSLTSDRFLFDVTTQHQNNKVANNGNEVIGQAKRFTFTFDGQPTGPFLSSPVRPVNTTTKQTTQVQHPGPRVKQPKAFNKKRPGRPTIQLGASPTLASKLAETLLPKVEAPSIGELNGKMPRPFVVNASPRRRRKTDKVTEEQIQMEEEARKIKSVQSARDCRKRKKEYIGGLQLAIDQYNKRESAAQHLIATLEKSIARLKLRTA